MSNLHVLGFLAIFVGPVLIADLIFRARSTPARRRARSEGRPLRTTRPRPARSDPMFWIGHGGSVRRWE